MIECGECYMFVYTLYKLSMSGYGYVLYESVSCVCLCFSDEPVLFLCICMKKYCNCLITCLDGPRGDKL